jgi:hypothetical protein
MSVIETLAQLAAPWQSLYGDSPLIATTVAGAHLGALVVGGGLALAADRGTLRALRAGLEGRRRHLEELRDVHRPVLIALAVVWASGVLLFAADVESLAASPAFWVKLGLVALLLANGAVLARTERALRRAPDGEAPDAAPLWRRLRRASVASAALWLAVVLAGVAVVNA